MKQSWSEMQDTKPMKIESVPTRSLLLFKLSRMNQGTLGHLQVALLLGFCRQDRTELRCVLHPTPLRMDMEKRTFFNAPVKYSEIPRVVLFKCSGFIYYLSPGFWRGTLSVLLRREERLWSSPLRAVCFSNEQSPRAGSGGGVLRGWVPCYLVHLVLL